MRMESVEPLPMSKQQSFGEPLQVGGLRRNDVLERLGITEESAITTVRIERLTLTSDSNVREATRGALLNTVMRASSRSQITPS